MKIAMFIAMLASAAGAQPITVAGRPYEKLATREATRSAMVARLTGSGATWGPWRVVGPFDHPGGGLDTQSPHEPEGELSAMNAGGAGPDFDRAFTGKGGAAIRWREAAEQPDIGGLGGLKPINLAEGLDAASSRNVAGYLHRTITGTGAIEANLGADDGVRVWFNGRLVADGPAERPHDPEQHRVVLELEPGINHLLVKVTQTAGEWEFSLAEAHELAPIPEAALEHQLDADFPDELDAWYRIVTIPKPAGASIEVGGLDVLPDGRPILCTRRGEVWIVDRAGGRPALDASWSRFASGLHEPLGLEVRAEDGQTVVHAAQRGELTRLRDTDGDDRADAYETVCDAWDVTGNYHEYAFGPEFDAQGRAWITLNLAHTGGETVMGATAPTRGTAVRVLADGRMEIVADGLRSPDGLGLFSDGQMFFTDNQGDYVATCRLAPLYDGSFHGHQASLKFREGYGEDWRARGLPVPEITPAAVWFPYKKMGQSASDILLDDTGGKFGPFAGQMFVGEQTLAAVYRVFLEKVDGVYQGACFPFRDGFASGVHRLAWSAPDEHGRVSMFVGMTDRGWGSVGPKRDGLQRLDWTGEVPFEIQEMRIHPHGFVLTFTKDIDLAAADLGKYRIRSHTYEYHPDYGSDEIDAMDHPITGVQRLDARTLVVMVEALRSGGLGYVHELTVTGLESAPDPAGVRSPLLHGTAYYTVQRLPAG